MTILVRSEAFGQELACVVAMATGRTRQEVLEDVALSDHEAIAYLSLKEAIIYLAKNGYHLGIGKMVKTNELADTPALLTIRTDLEGLAHCGYWDGEKLWDPSRPEPRDMGTIKDEVLCLLISPIEEEQ